MNVTLFVLLAAPWLSPPGVPLGSPLTPGVVVPASPAAVAKQTFEAPRLPLLGTRASGSETQLTGPTSGVTCTLRIIPVSPAGDRGILRPVEPRESSANDAIVRRDLAPCLR